ncbi:hypothetical protein C9I98_03145 [Photobacterium sanctipauli]|uniref:Porin n=1 Tax=Photobacterium sanctipauli TaxID=1342794 RepID=A0A2T3P166_9GAMM|nr:hypothetical protein [Photobacterium sanctipauli]PSW22273.1 hypothetical protein C9I98_03145 [Photobacterium sanctipauli]
MTSPRLWLLPCWFFIASSYAAIDNSRYDLSVNGLWFAEQKILGPTPSYRHEERLYQTSYGVQGQAEWQGSLANLPWRVAIFGNWDEQDPERRYWDIREAHATKIWQDFELTAGISRVFWGVSESINVVNVINQADLTESFDGKVKLGQPMISLFYAASEADITLIYMPVFRERLYPLRPNTGMKLADNAVFEDGKEDGGWATRAKFYTDNGEWAIGAFTGTRRVPILRPSPSSGRLMPYYIQTHNLLFDGLYLGEVLTPKIEVKAGRELDDNFVAINAGVEYRTYPNISNLNEVTLIGEYLYDSRKETVENHGQNDVFIGMRAEIGTDSDMKLLFSHDLSYASQYLELSLQYRINDYVRLMGKATSIMNASPDDMSLYPYKDEDFVRASLHVAF